jgi:hypothetical protein
VLKNSFLPLVKILQPLGAGRIKKMRGTSRFDEKSAKNHRNQFLDGVEREKSLAIEFGVIFEGPDFSRFSTK